MRLLVALLATALLVTAPVVGLLHEHPGGSDLDCTACQSWVSQAPETGSGVGRETPRGAAAGAVGEPLPLPAGAPAGPGIPRAPPA